MAAEVLTGEKELKKIIRKFVPGDEMDHALILLNMIIALSRSKGKIDAIGKTKEVPVEANGC